MKKNINRTHRLLVEVLDEINKVYFDQNGNRFVKTKWYEVKEINLGSINKPNKKIRQILLKPILKEKTQ